MMDMSLCEINMDNNQISKMDKETKSGLFNGCKSVINLVHFSPNARNK